MEFSEFTLHSQIYEFKGIVQVIYPCLNIYYQRIDNICTYLNSSKHKPSGFNLNKIIMKKI